MMVRELAAVYIVVSTGVSFWAMMKIPSKSTPTENVVGSLVAAVSTGWLFWPLILLAAAKQKRSTK